MAVTLIPEICGTSGGSTGGAVSGDVGTLDQLDLTNSNPAAVAIVDGNGDQITSFGGGAQYTEGDTDATITGTAMLVEGAANALVPLQGTVADGLLVNLGANNDVTVTGTVGISGTVGVTATNLDIRDLTSAADSVAAVQSGTWNVNAVQSGAWSVALDAATLTALETINAVQSGTWTVALDSASLTALETINAAQSGTWNVGLNSGTNYVGRVRLTDGTNDVTIDTVHGDGESNTENHQDVAAKLMAFNGTTWDRLRSDATSTGVLQVAQTAVASNGASTMNASSSDGATALTATAQAIKASAGTLQGYYIYNPNSSAAYVQFYNTASGSVTVGTTAPLFMLTIPATSAANLALPQGIQFSTAMSWAATSTAGGNGAPTTALDAVCWFK